MKYSVRLISEIKLNKVIKLVVLVFSVIFSSLSAQTTVYVSPQNLEVTGTGTFSLQVMISNAVNLHGASVTVTFDTTIIKYSSAAKGALLLSNAEHYDVYLGKQYSPSSIRPNQVTIDQAILGESAVSGSGVLFKLNFTPVAQGTTPITIINQILLDTKSELLPATFQSGSVTIVNPVPVELTEFSGKEKNGEVVLQWKTATEINCYGFEIERVRHTPPSGYPSRRVGTSSLEGITPPAGIKKGWETIGFVKGAGTSFISHTYTFTDHTPSSGQAEYRLKQIDIDGQFKYYDAISITVNAPTQYRLLQNSPNPFNPSTAIKFQMPVDGLVTIKIYDQIGREVTTLVNEVRSAGSHIVYWNGRDMNGQTVASGIYLYRLSSGSFSETKKMNFTK